MSVKNNFLQYLAKECKKQFDHHCDQLTIIFPNKRAGVYFAEYLAQLYNQPVWSPVILSFEEFVEQKQNKNFADDLQLIFLLYKAYKQIVKSPEEFDAFFPWGEMLLKDFNDIDNYLVDVDHIFKVISSQKELDQSFRYLSEKDQLIIQSFWKGFLPTPNKKQNEFIATWAILSDLYYRFNELLNDNGLTYKGRMLREYAEANDKNHSTTMWFAGFNALTGAEEKIIKSYLDAGQTDIFWDVDRYYLEDKNQESGIFYRIYAEDKHFKSSILRDQRNSILESNINIEAISAPFNMGQIKAAAETIKELNLNNKEQTETLIILTNESLLQQVLESLPESIENVNVSMGWPIVQSRTYLFISKLIGLHEKYYSHPSKKIQHKEILSLLEYNDILNIQPDRVNQFDSKAIKSNLVYQSIDAVKDTFPEFADLLRFGTSTIDFISNLTDFISSSTISSDLKELDQSALVLIHSTLKRIDKAIQQNEITLGFSSFYKLFNQLGSVLKLSLSGDHKAGVQIMGILETRNLSFKNTFILGMNEGNWPKDSSNTSFIPYNIRRAFNLPTIEHQDAMQSYLFYRLLHSSENIKIYYNNISEFNHNGELSRYVKQLNYETKLNIEYASLVNPISAESELKISVSKDESVKEKLNEFLLGEGQTPRRLSPSALNTYIDCKLKFYFQHIARIKEPDELIEDIDPSLFGNLLHGAMENLYQNKDYWDVSDLDQVEANLDQAINQSFIENKITQEEQTGRQIIAFEVIKAYMHQIIKYDQSHAPFRIIGLEAKDYTVDFPIETMNGTEKVGLKGIIDRIDEFGEVIRILDYKSGRDERKFGEMFDLKDGESNKRNKAVFQLFYYCMLFKENHPEITRPIQPGLFNSKELFDEKFDTLISQTINKKSHKVLNYADYEEEFKVMLEYLLTEIFNEHVPFSQTEDEKKCLYCTYKEICNKG